MTNYLKGPSPLTLSFCHSCHLFYVMLYYKPVIKPDHQPLPQVQRRSSMADVLEQLHAAGAGAGAPEPPLAGVAPRASSFLNLAVRMPSFLRSSLRAVHPLPPTLLLPLPRIEQGEEHDEPWRGGEGEGGAAAAAGGSETMMTGASWQLWNHVSDVDADSASADVVVRNLMLRLGPGLTLPGEAAGGSGARGGRRMSASSSFSSGGRYVGGPLQPSPSRARRSSCVAWGSSGDPPPSAATQDPGPDPKDALGVAEDAGRWAYKVSPLTRGGAAATAVPAAANNVHKPARRYASFSQGQGAVAAAAGGGGPQASQQLRRQSLSFAASAFLNPPRPPPPTSSFTHALNLGLAGTGVGAGVGVSGGFGARGPIYHSGSLHSGLPLQLTPAIELDDDQYDGYAPAEGQGGQSEHAGWDDARGRSGSSALGSGSSSSLHTPPLSQSITRRPGFYVGESLRKASFSHAYGPPPVEVDSRPELPAAGGRGGGFSLAGDGAPDTTHWSYKESPSFAATRVIRHDGLSSTSVPLLQPALQPVAVLRQASEGDPVRLSTAGPGSSSSFSPSTRAPPPLPDSFRSMRRIAGRAGSRLIRASADGDFSDLPRMRAGGDGPSSSGQSALLDVMRNRHGSASEVPGQVWWPGGGPSSMHASMVMGAGEEVDAQLIHVRPADRAGRPGPESSGPSMIRIRPVLQTASLFPDPDPDLGGPDWTSTDMEPPFLPPPPPPPAATTHDAGSAHRTTSLRPSTPPGEEAPSRLLASIRRPASRRPSRLSDLVRSSFNEDRPAGQGPPSPPSPPPRYSGPGSGSLAVSAPLSRRPARDSVEGEGEEEGSCSFGRPEAEVDVDVVRGRCKQRLEVEAEDDDVAVRGLYVRETEEDVGVVRGRYERPAVDADILPLSEVEADPLSSLRHVAGGVPPPHSDRSGAGGGWPGPVRQAGEGAAGRAMRAGAAASVERQALGWGAGLLDAALELIRLTEGQAQSVKVGVGYWVLWFRVEVLGMGCAV